MKRKRSPTEHSAMWECAACIEQMVGGPRCFEHNPTPEQRQAQPERYLRRSFMPHRKDRRGAA